MADRSTQPAVTDDSELVRRCREGDRASFDALVRQHYTLAYNVAFRMLGDHDAAADATQAAFVRAYKAISRFRRDATFSTWLYRIVTNVCLDQLRRNQHSTQSLTLLDEDDAGGFEEMDIADETADPAGRIEQRAQQEIVQEAMSRLAVSHRSVLILYDIIGRSYEEIAEILRIPLGTVKSRLNRARHALKQELVERGELSA